VQLRLSSHSSARIECDLAVPSSFFRKERIRLSRKKLKNVSRKKLNWQEVVTEVQILVGASGI